MSTLRATFVALVGTAFMIPGAALAEPLRCNFNGHHYEVIDYSCGSFDAGQCWEAAKLEAESRTYAGAFGKLVTITSEDEQSCVEDVYTPWKAGKNKPEVWIGGFQEPGALEVGDNWVWIDGEGDIPGTNHPMPPETGYANWRDGEPNDVNSGPGEDGGEDHLALGLGGGPTWNDEGAPGNIGGVGIEFETSTEIVDIDECLDPDGCPLNDALNIIYEDVVCLDDPGDCSTATLEANSWQILDPRVADGTCGSELLNLFLDGNDNLTVQAAVEPASGAVSTLPRHLCGHPNFVVTKTIVDGFKIGETAAIIETDPPPGNNYECGPLDLTDPIDNTVWDVTAYQTTEKAEMVETHVPMTGINQLFAGGTVLESLFDCSSSRGKGFRDSWYFSGLCIAFGGEGCPTDPSLPSTPISADNFDLMNAFLIYKLERTIEVLDEAKGNHAFRRWNDYWYLRKQVLQAIKMTRKDNYRAAFAKIKNAQRRLARTRFRDVPDERYPAELDTRLSNVAFTSKERIVQYLSLY